MKEIDARGLSCPTPVLLAKDAVEMDNADQVTVVVDNKPARENLALFFASKRFVVSTEEKSGEYTITATRDAARAAARPAGPDPGKKDCEESKIMVMVTADRIGRGDDGLGGKLMLNFIKTLPEMGAALWRLVLVNSGVKLAAAGSPALADLQRMEANGLHLLVCGTCLDHFNLLEEKKAGITTNMLDIVTAMQLADKVIDL